LSFYPKETQSVLHSNLHYLLIQRALQKALISKSGQSAVPEN